MRGCAAGKLSRDDEFDIEMPRDARTNRLANATPLA
jgi:hypothetical protein